MSAISIKKKALIPNYIYSGRTTLEAVNFFEDQYYKQNIRYDSVVAENPDFSSMALRVAYAFMAELKKFEEPLRDKDTVVIFGNQKFQWTFVKPLIDKNSVIYSFGAGVDISFEEQLTTEFGCVVHCFDPTPQAIECCLPIAKRNPLIKFNAIGVLSRDEVARFYRPTTYGIGSLSATNLAYSTVYLEAQCLRLRTIMARNKHASIDLLKIDIEGAEHDVIEDLIFCELDVKQICVEFDQPMPPWRIDSTMRKLFLAGYILIDVTALNCLFVRGDVLRAANLVETQAGSE